MADILNNCTYDKIKILHELCCVLWFIKKHALRDAENDQACKSFLQNLEKDLEKYVNELQTMICK